METAVKDGLMAGGQRPDMVNLKPLDEPSSVNSVNLLNRHWEQLDTWARETGLSRSSIVRRALDQMQQAVILVGDLSPLTRDGD